MTIPSHPKIVKKTHFYRKLAQYIGNLLLSQNKLQLNGMADY
jgi:hypothetical protein